MRLRHTHSPRVDVTKIWAEYDGVTGEVLNITASNSTANTTTVDIVDPRLEPPKVDTSKIWAEYDGNGKLVSGALPVMTTSVSTAATVPTSAALTATTASNGMATAVGSIEQEKRIYSDIGVVFLGDSTIAHINQNKTYWQYLETKYHALNLAIPGEHTENLLYRLQNTDLSDIKQARLVVVLIGTLNIGAKDSPESVKNGIAAIVDQAKKTFVMNTTFAVLGILPRFSTRMNVAINATNTFLGELYKPVPGRPDINSNVKFFDFTSYFLDASNPSGLREEYYMPDLLHPSTKGYAAIFSMLEPLIGDLHPKRRRSLRNINS